MEAFARARPVVATDVAGIPELVSHRCNGILVAPDDPESLALGLNELLDMTPEELFRLGCNGRKLIEERHLSERNARALIGVWQGIRGA